MTPETAPGPALLTRWDRWINRRGWWFWVLLGALLMGGRIILGECW
jgi:hypothetical protein